MAPLDDLQVPKLPPIEVDGLDDESALALNDSDIELWEQSHNLKCNKKDTNPSDNQSHKTITKWSKRDTRSERHTTQCTSSVSRKEQMYVAPFVVNIPVIDENNVLNDDITADQSDERNEQYYKIFWIIKIY